MVKFVEAEKCERVLGEGELVGGEVGESEEERSVSKGEDADVVAPGAETGRSAASRPIRVLPEREASELRLASLAGGGAVSWIATGRLPVVVERGEEEFGPAHTPNLVQPAEQTPGRGVGAEEVDEGAGERCLDVGLVEKEAVGRRSDWSIALQWVVLQIGEAELVHPFPHSVGVASRQVGLEAHIVRPSVLP